VLCVDEKSQIQALDRTERGLPMKQGRCGTMTHDYKRNGTTTLFAALNVLGGTVVGECMPRHRHQEFLRFMRRLDQEFPPDLDLHLILDNDGTHQHPKVKNGWAKHRRFQLHFTPTRCSWLNLAERWFAKLTKEWHPPRNLFQCRGIAAGYRGASGTEQAVPLDGHSRTDPGEGASFVKLF
jgi:transposase